MVTKELKERITYAELANRLGSVFLFNKAPELDNNIYDGLENGTLDYCDEHEKCDMLECEPIGQHEIFQWYLISQSDAEYLKRVTNELIFYSEVLDEYIWGVTHFGTSWDYVKLEVVK